MKWHIEGSMISNSVCPSAIIRTAYWYAFDNFARTIETFANKITLNDNVGIVHQNIPFPREGNDNNYQNNGHINNTVQSMFVRKRRKTFDDFVPELP